MLKFDDWKITSDGSLIARQYDNLSRELLIEGDIPMDYHFDLITSSGENLNIISLDHAEGYLRVLLTAEMLPVFGAYEMQLRGTRGEEVKHTNIIRVFIPESMSGDVKWPTVPSEFTQLEQRVQASAAEARASAEAAAQSAKDTETAAQGAAEQTAQQLRGEFEPLVQAADNSAQSAGAAADRADGAAAAAAQSAAATGASAEQAWTAAQSAADSAGAAGDSAAAAAAAGQTAQEAAEQAQQSAETANQRAQEAGNHAAAAAQSAGAAADAKTAAEIAAGNAEQSAQAAKEAAEQAAAGGGAVIDDTKAQTDKTWSSLAIVDRLAPPFAVSGSIVTCEPVEGYPLQVVSQIVPIQEGEGDPSPDNVRPITGWTAVSLWHGGANIIDVSDEVIIPQENYSIYAPDILIDAIKSLPRGKTLYMSWDDIGTGPDASSNQISFYNTGVSIGVTVRRNQPFVIPDDAEFTSLLCYAGQNKTQDAVWSNFRCGPTLESVVEYTPYNPASQTITLPFGQTVYGGSIDWATGVLTVDTIYLRLTSSMDIATYTYQELAGIWISGVLDGSYIRADGVCTHAKVLLQGESTLSTNMWLGAGNAAIYWIGILDALGLSTREEFKEWLDGQNVYIAYKSTSTTSIQLTPTEILALSGTNTLYTDTGDTTVSGRADPAAIINQLAQRIAALESAAAQF